jgi:ABC-type Zn uptake system ZnuABC Zn-binding protein ZnuA
MSELTKEYFDAKFDAVSDRLEKIERNQGEIFETIGAHRELIGTIDTAFQVFENDTRKSLESGNKKFGYVEREIGKIQRICSKSEHEKTKQQVAILIKIMSVIGTGFLGLAVKAIWDLIVGG